MNQTWLEDFLTLAATGNFSRAAEKRHMTQPAFSRRVRALEEWLGVELFDRSTQPAQLTPAGVWFKDEAQNLMAQFVRLPGEARAVADENASMLRFAATHALSFTFLPGWLRALEARTGIQPVQLVSDVMHRCEALLQQRRVQFVLSHAHPDSGGVLAHAGYPSVRVGRDTLLPVSAANAAGEPIHTLDGDAAARGPLLTYSQESGLGRILREVHGAKLGHVSAQTALTAHLATVLKTMAVDGRGIAWLPKALISDELENGLLVVAGSEIWFVELEVRLYRDTIALGKVAEAFWTAVEDNASVG